MDDWFTAVKTGLKVKSRCRWLGLVREWSKALAQHEGESFEPTLSFPLAAGLGLEVQTAGWFRWLESRMDLEHRVVSLVVTSCLANGAGRLTMIARDVLPDDFLLLTSMAGTLAYVDDLSEVGPSDTVEEDDAPMEFAGQDAEDPASWAVFVLGEDAPT